MSASNRGTVKWRYSAEYKREVWQARWTRGDKTVRAARTPFSTGDS